MEDQQETYNNQKDIPPNTGRSYSQITIEQVHNIKKEVYDPLEMIEYCHGEDKIVTAILKQSNEKCNA